MRSGPGLSAATGSVARILGIDGVIVGSGFLISDRHVMTCAHVLDDAFGRDRGTEPRPEGEVLLDLPFLDRKGLAASVVEWRAMRSLVDLEQNAVADIAVLELVEPVEGGLDGRSACMCAPPTGTLFQTFGFPAGMDNGAEAGGELRIADAGGWRQIRDTQNHGYFVAPGFSGGPVLDAEAARYGQAKLLGMVVAADADSAKRLAFAIPVYTLCQAWPLLATPYKGLASFEAEDAELFFGREEKISELIRKVAGHGFVTLLGPSGSGKSSLVRAGLVPRLQAEGGWSVGITRPGNNPLYELAKVLADDGTGVRGYGLDRRAHELAAELAADPRRLLDVVPTLLQAVPGRSRLLLVIDQFEELFTLEDARPEGPQGENSVSERQKRYIAVLEQIGRQAMPDAPIRAVATLRADFTGRALEFEALEKLMTSADVKLGPLSEDGLEHAVELPARHFGVRFEHGLVERIVGTMKNTAGGLPLMQFALDAVWQRQRDRTLTHSDYDAIGGVEGALADHAEAYYSRQPLEKQTAIRRVLTRLVRLAPSAGNAEDTRAVVTRAEIGDNDWDIVQSLAKERLVTLDQDMATQHETAELVHEALIAFTRTTSDSPSAVHFRSWGRLRSWLDEDREFGLWRQRLRGYVENFVEKGSHLPDDLVPEAETWWRTRSDSLNRQEKDLIRTSIEEQERRKKERHDREKERIRLLEERNSALADTTIRQKIWFRRLALVVVLLIITTFGASFFWWSANSEKRRANDFASRADAAAIEAESTLQTYLLNSAINVAEQGQPLFAQKLLSYVGRRSQTIPLNLGDGVTSLARRTAAELYASRRITAILPHGQAAFSQGDQAMFIAGAQTEATIYSSTKHTIVDQIGGLDEQVPYGFTPGWEMFSQSDDRRYFAINRTGINERISDLSSGEERSLVRVFDTESDELRAHLRRGAYDAISFIPGTTLYAMSGIGGTALFNAESGDHCLSIFKSSGIRGSGYQRLAISKDESLLYGGVVFGDLGRRLIGKYRLDFGSLDCSSQDTSLIQDPEIIEVTSDVQGIFVSDVHGGLVVVQSDQVQFYSYADNLLEFTIEPLSGEITASTISQNGEDVFIGTSTGVVAKIDLDSGTYSARGLLSSGITAFARQQAGDYVVAYSNDPGRVFRLAKSDLASDTVELSSFDISGVDISESGQSLLVSTSMETLRIEFPVSESRSLPNEAAGTLYDFGSDFAAVRTEAGNLQFFNSQGLLLSTSSDESSHYWVFEADGSLISISRRRDNTEQVSINVFSLLDGIISVSTYEIPPANVGILNFFRFEMSNWENRNLIEGENFSASLEDERLSFLIGRALVDFKLGSVGHDRDCSSAEIRTPCKLIGSFAEGFSVVDTLGPVVGDAGHFTEVQDFEQVLWIEVPNVGFREITSMLSPTGKIAVVALGVPFIVFELSEFRNSGSFSFYSSQEFYSRELSDSVTMGRIGQIEAVSLGGSAEGFTIALGNGYAAVILSTPDGQLRTSAVPCDIEWCAVRVTPLGFFVLNNENSYSPFGNQRIFTPFLFQPSSGARRPLSGHEDTVNMVRFSDDFSVGATADHSGRVILWDLVNLIELGRFEIGGWPHGLWVSSDGASLIASSRERGVFFRRSSSSVLKVDPVDYWEAAAVSAEIDASEFDELLLDRLTSPHVKGIELPEVASSDSAMVKCRKLASHPLDPRRVGPGVPFVIIDAELSADLCSAAIDENPNSGEARYNLSRALAAADLDERSENELHRAVELGDPMAVASYLESSATDTVPIVKQEQLLEMIESASYEGFALAIFVLAKIKYESTGDLSALGESIELCVPQALLWAAKHHAKMGDDADIDKLYLSAAKAAYAWEVVFGAENTEARNLRFNASSRLEPERAVQLFETAQTQVNDARSRTE